VFVEDKKRVRADRETRDKEKEKVADMLLFVVKENREESFVCVFVTESERTNMCS